METRSKSKAKTEDNVTQDKNICMDLDKTQISEGSNGLLNYVGRLLAIFTQNPLIGAFRRFFTRQREESTEKKASSTPTTAADSADDSEKSSNATTKASNSNDFN